MESNWYEIMMTKVSEVNRRLGGDGFGFFQIANKGGRWRLNCSSECFLEEWEVLRLVDIIEYLFVQDSRSMNTNAFRFFVEDILIKWKNIKEEDKFRYEDVGGVKQKALIFGGWQMTGFDCWIKGDILFEGVYEAYYMVYGGSASGNMKAEPRVGSKVMGPITIKVEAGKTIDQRLEKGIKERITIKEEAGKIVGKEGEEAPRQKEEERVLVPVSRLNEAIKKVMEDEKKIRAKVVGELNDKITRDREKMGKIDETIGNIFRLIEKARALTDNVEKVFRGSINAVSTDLVKLNDRVTRNRDEIFSIVGNERGQKDKAIGALEDKVKRLEEAFSILRLAVEGRQGEASDKLYSNILNSKKE